MMRQMGMSQKELNATEVVIKTSEGKELVFSNPQVQAIKMQGQETFQLSGDYVERETSVKLEISDDDVNMVVEQAGVSKEEAMKALDDAKGDIAQAIVNLSN